MNEKKPCEFTDLCEKCHPEKNMEERRAKGCDEKNCRLCAVYWAYWDGYYGIDED